LDFFVRFFEDLENYEEKIGKRGGGPGPGGGRGPWTFWKNVLGIYFSWICSDYFGNLGICSDFGRIVLTGGAGRGHREIREHPSRTEIIIAGGANEED